MSKSDLQARPIYHHKHESIEAHLTIGFASLAVSRWIEVQTGWSIRKFVRTRPSGPNAAERGSGTSPVPCGAVGQGDTRDQSRGWQRPQGRTQ
jgi:hypothetical protein